MGQILGASHVAVLEFDAGFKIQTTGLVGEMDARHQHKRCGSLDCLPRTAGSCARNTGGI
jgi:hypothetical protein